ncbi:hypothetical protein ACQRC6_09435 [Peptoniphilus sp. SGI.035]|uniref:hypothetical protein n=1 Tax=Peptoniphilus sp. SGI.035 TaxID=3420564 RepID=UPI003D081D78
MKIFAEKLAEFKQKSIGELDKKTEELLEFKEIVDTMSELSKKIHLLPGLQKALILNIE